MVPTTGQHADPVMFAGFEELEELYERMISGGESDGHAAEGSRTKAFDLCALRCQECRSEEVVYETMHHAFVCKECGVMTESLLDEGPESNFQDGMPRTGSAYNTAMPSSYLCTKLTGGRYVKVYNYSGMSYKDRSMAEKFHEIENACKRYRVPKPVVDTTKILYHQLRECRYKEGPHQGKSMIHRGNKLKQLIGACLMYGARMEGCQMPVEQVAAILCIEGRSVTRGRRRYWKLIDDKYGNIFNIESIKALKKVQGLHRVKRLDDATCESACAVVANMYKLNIATNHQPDTVASVAVLLALDDEGGDSKSRGKHLNEAKKMLQEHFDLSPVTLAQIVKEVKPYRRVLCSKELTEHVLRRKEEILLARQRSDDDDIVILGPVGDGAEEARRPRGRPRNGEETN